MPNDSGNSDSELKYKRRKKRSISGKTFQINPPSKTRSKTMRKIKSAKTKPEEILGKKMWSLGLRYRRKSRLPGKPDFVFARNKTVVFVDGDFWHGKDWTPEKAKFKNNRDFWIAKIQRNIERDEEVNKNLKELGWHVIRFWESDIKKSPDLCAQQVLNVLKGRLQ